MHHLMRGLIVTSAVGLALLTAGASNSDAAPYHGYRHYGYGGYYGGVRPYVGVGIGYPAYYGGYGYPSYGYASPGYYGGYYPGYYGYGYPGYSVGWGYGGGRYYSHYGHYGHYGRYGRGRR